MDLGAYLDKLRALIPARTFALYILGVGLVAGIADTPEAVAKDYGWLLLVVTAICIVFNIIGRLVGKRGWADCFISSGAFLLLACTQRFTGPLAALGITSKGVFVLMTFLAAAYVAVVTMFWKPPVGGMDS